jgi:AcrR family transcriptional regulator
MAKNKPARGPGRPRGARRDPEERRQELLDAAEAAIRRDGADVSMEQIAAEAGITKPTLYDHFDGKGALTDALLDRYGVRLMGRLLAGMGEPMPPGEILRGGIEEFLTSVERDPEIVRFILAGSGSRTMLDEAGVHVSALVGTALRQAGVDSGGAEPIAHALLGAIFAAAQWWMDRRTMSRADFVDYLVDFVWAGLAGTGIGELDKPIDLSGLAQVIVAELPELATPTDAGATPATPP